MHQNTGIHLDGGIEDNGKSQHIWKNIICLRTQLHDVLYGWVRNIFVLTLVVELDGIQNQNYNAERVIIF